MTGANLTGVIRIVDQVIDQLLDMELHQAYRHARQLKAILLDNSEAK